jgi:hypothetical protein
MISGRFFTAALTFLLLGCFPAGSAMAFWGFGDDQGKSGLDFEKGYDVNTVTTVRGKVVSLQMADGKGPVTIIVKQGAGTIHVVAAPEWYWSDRGIDINSNDEVEVSGAKAQGKDGNMYIISRKITNLSTGDTVTLRAETGRPAWKTGGHAGRGGGGGMQRRHGGGMRGR